jgi:hypothetical protein
VRGALRGYEKALGKTIPEHKRLPAIYNAYMLVNNAVADYGKKM